MSSIHEAWGNQEHAAHFDSLSRTPEFILRRAYERFNEVRLLNEALARREGPLRLLEVGCATGEFYRYLRLRHPQVTYVGCDISRPAVNRARQKYPAEGRFIETDAELRAVDDIKPDALFCRDVAHHQPDPIAFIRKLYAMTACLLVMRIRTRDVGDTIRDPAVSCQLNYGMWAPYIVVNNKELLSAVEGFIPPPKQVRLAKHHMVLGGQHARYLPKECYLRETGTAESALLVEKGSGGDVPQVVEEVMPERLQLPLSIRVLLRLCQGRTT